MSLAPSRVQTTPSVPDQTTAVEPLRFLTFDVEEAFHIEAAAGTIRREQWRDLPSRAPENVDRILALLDKHSRLATFFFLGDVARRCPTLARTIARAGHEVACHGFNHSRLHRLTPPQLAQDIRAARSLLEDQLGQPVLGYRAPSWSLTRQTAWAVDVLAAAGFAYDASVFPVRHPSYGVPDAPSSPCWLRGSSGEQLLEVPPLVWRFAGSNLAAAGGAYFRLLPLALMRAALRQAASEQRPAVLYFHPWEFDGRQPRLPHTTLNRLRPYTGIRRAACRLERLLALPGRWLTLRDALPELARLAATRPVFSLSAP